MFDNLRLLHAPQPPPHGLEAEAAPAGGRHHWQSLMLPLLLPLLPLLTDAHGRAPAPWLPSRRRERRGKRKVPPPLLHPWQQQRQPASRWR